MSYLLEHYTAEQERQDEAHSWVTQADINRERYHAEIADSEREWEIDNDWRNEMRAKELEVTVDFVVDADEEWSRQYRFMHIVKYHRMNEDCDVEGDEIPF